MLAASLARALSEAARRPGRALAISAAHFFVFLLPGLAAAWKPAPVAWAAAGAWNWWGAAWLALACKASREDKPRWLKESAAAALRLAPERLVSFAFFALLAVWAAAALRFYRQAGPSWLAYAGLGAAALAGLWLALAALLSVPLAADGAPWPTRWKAALLLPLAFFPACLGAGAVLLFLSGAPALAWGLERRLAALLWWPAALMPILTPAYAGWFLLALCDAMRARGQGRPEPAGPALRELFQPWR